MTRPLCYLDLEGTGINPATDRIIQVALIVGRGERFCRYVNPGIPIPPEVTKLTGITDDQVAGMPPFADVASEVRKHLDGADIVGFGCAGYDIPLLVEEFTRVGIDWEPPLVIDLAVAAKRLNPRDLAAMHQQYVGTELYDAHNALADVMGTQGLHAAMLARHQELRAMSREELASFCRYDKPAPIDPAGKLVMVNGRPTYTFGKHKGVAVEDEQGFARWMLAKDFPEATKAALVRILGEIEERERAKQPSLWDRVQDEIAPGVDIPF